MITGIYGGAFAPPHNGHVYAAKAFYEQMGLDRLIVIPNYLAPNKVDGRPYDAEHRLAMSKLAFARVAPGHVEVSSIECDRRDFSYTVDTLRELDEKQGIHCPYFLCGADKIPPFTRKPDVTGIDHCIG